MASVRLWHAAQLATVWLAVPVVVLVVREVMGAGIYEATLEGQRVTIVSGLWSASFATALTLAVGAIGLATAASLTWVWVTGSRERRRRATMIGKPHRRPLI